MFLDYADLVSRKALLLFLSVGTIWGTPYFFIAIAIEDFQTPSIVFLRVLLGALILMPIAISRGMIRATLKAWPAVLAFDQISATLAVVKMQLEMFGGVMQDYLNLSYLDGQWWVVAKMWEKVGESEP